MTPLNPDPAPLPTAVPPAALSSGPTAVETQLQDQFQALVYTLTARIAPGWAQSLALQRLEESIMWARKAIRDEQTRSRLSDVASSARAPP